MKPDPAPKLKIEAFQPFTDPVNVARYIASSGAVIFATYRGCAREDMLRVLCEANLKKVFALEILPDEVDSKYEKAVRGANEEEPDFEFIGPEWARKVTFPYEGLPRCGGLLVCDKMKISGKKDFENIIEFSGPPRFILFLEMNHLPELHEWYEWLEKENWTLGILKSPRYETTPADPAVFNGEEFTVYMKNTFDYEVRTIPQK